MSPYASCDQSLTYALMSLQNASSPSHSSSVPLYSDRLVLGWPAAPITYTAPFTAGPAPPASWSPRTRSRRFFRALSVPWRTADDDSLTAQMSPAVTSNPCAAMRRRASTPASYQLAPVVLTQELQPL